MSSDREAIDAGPRAARLRGDEEAWAAIAEFTKGPPDHRKPDAERFSTHGFCGLNVPRRYGGAFLSYRTIAEIVVALAAYDPRLADVARRQVEALEFVRRSGTPSQQRTIFERALNGRRFAGMDLADPNAGEEGLRLSQGLITGTLRLTSTEDLAQTFLLPLSYQEGHLVRIVLDRDTPGVTLEERRQGDDIESDRVRRLALHQVSITADRIIDASGERAGVPPAIRDLLHAAIDTGTARKIIADILALMRRQTKPEVSGERSIDEILALPEAAELHVRLHTAEAVLSRAGQAVDAWLKDETASRAHDALVASYEARVLATEAWDAATRAMSDLAERQWDAPRHRLGGGRLTPSRLVTIGLHTVHGTDTSHALPA